MLQFLATILLHPRHLNAINHSAEVLVLSQVVDLLDLLKHLSVINLQVGQQAVVEVKDPAVHHGEVVLGVRLLHSGGLDDVATLLLDIELNQAVVLLLLILNGVELVFVEPIHIANVTQPWVEKPQIFRCHGGLDTTAAVVSADNNVLDAEVTNGVVDDGHNIEVRVADKVRNVAVDESLTGLETRDLLSRDTRVAASDPEVLGSLSCRQLRKVLGVLGTLLLGPGAVVLKQTLVRLLQVLGDFIFSHCAPRIVFLRREDFVAVLVAGVRRDGSSAVGNERSREISEGGCSEELS